MFEDIICWLMHGSKSAVWRTNSALSRNRKPPVLACGRSPMTGQMKAMISSQVM